MQLGTLRREKKTINFEFVGGEFESSQCEPCRCIMVFRWYFLWIQSACMPIAWYVHWLKFFFFFWFSAIWKLIGRLRFAKNQHECCLAFGRLDLFLFLFDCLWSVQPNIFGGAAATNSKPLNKKKNRSVSYNYSFICYNKLRDDHKYFWKWKFVRAWNVHSFTLSRIATFYSVHSFGIGAFVAELAEAHESYTYTLHSYM